MIAFDLTSSANAVNGQAFLRLPAILSQTTIRKTKR
jgi:hypothetical protein